MVVRRPFHLVFLDVAKFEEELIDVSEASGAIIVRTHCSGYVANIELLIVVGHNGIE